MPSKPQRNEIGESTQPAPGVSGLAAKGPTTATPNIWAKPDYQRAATPASHRGYPSPHASEGKSEGGGSLVNATNYSYQQLQTQVALLTQTVSQLQEQIKELHGKLINKEKSFYASETTAQEESDNTSGNNINNSNGDSDSLDNQFRKENVHILQEQVRQDTLDATLRLRAPYKMKWHKCPSRLRQSNRGFTEVPRIQRLCH